MKKVLLKLKCCTPKLISYYIILPVRNKTHHSLAKKYYIQCVNQSYRKEEAPHGLKNFSCFAEQLGYFQKLRYIIYEVKNNYEKSFSHL